MLPVNLKLVGALELVSYVDIGSGKNTRFWGRSQPEGTCKE